MDQRGTSAAETKADRARRGRRVAWFLALYATSAVAFAAFTYGLRALIPR